LDHFHRLIQLESKAIDQILENPSHLAELAVRATKADMVTVDIIKAIRSSDLKTRDLMADTLIDFARGGYSTSEGLQTLDKKVSGVVDRQVVVS
jgi:hypothetical protein